MSSKSGKPKRPRDPNQLGKLMADIATGEVSDIDPNEGKSAVAVKRGRSGGLKGGAARMAMLTATQRTDLAKKAASKRWSKGRASNKRTARS